MYVFLFIRVDCADIDCTKNNGFTTELFESLRVVVKKEIEKLNMIDNAVRLKHLRSGPNRVVCSRTTGQILARIPEEKGGRKISLDPAVLRGPGNLGLLHFLNYRNN